MIVGISGATGIVYGIRLLESHKSFGRSSRAHPHDGEVCFENRAQNNLPVFLEPDEKFRYHTTKAVHNCLVADRFAKDERPMVADLAHGWPLQIQKRVLDGWRSYGYR